MSEMASQTTSLTIAYSTVYSSADVGNINAKKTSKLRIIGLCEENSPVTDALPAQRAGNAENVSIWWRHHIVIANCTSPTGHLIQVVLFIIWELRTKYDRNLFSYLKRQNESVIEFYGPLLCFDCDFGCYIHIAINHNIEHEKNGVISPVLCFQNGFEIQYHLLPVAQLTLQNANRMVRVSYFMWPKVYLKTTVFFIKLNLIFRFTWRQLYDDSIAAWEKFKLFRPWSLLDRVLTFFMPGTRWARTVRQA